MKKNPSVSTGSISTRLTRLHVLIIMLCAALAACGGGGGGATSGSDTGSGAASGSSSGSGSTTGSGAGTTTGGTGTGNPPPGTSNGPTPPAISADGYTPLFAAGTPMLEQIQYTEADGTLVTLVGYRPTQRHARESNNHGYLQFPALYFSGRTFGLMIRDGIPAGRSNINFYIQSNMGTIVNASVNVFRDRQSGNPAYGWIHNAGMQNILPQWTNFAINNQSNFNGNICFANSGPMDCAGPSLTQREDNGSGPDEQTRPFKMGDAFEVSSAIFLAANSPTGFMFDSNAPAALDGGPVRDYSLEQLYVVGKGIVPWYGGGTTPLYSIPLPDDALSGGQASLDYNYSGQPHRMFQQVVNNVGAANIQRFVEGRRLFHTSFLTGQHTENLDLNPPLLQYANQLGPRYNAERCIACHTLDGRSPPAQIANTLDTMVILTAANSTATSITPDPVYGLDVQQHALNASAPNFAVTVASYTQTTVTLAGGETVQLQKPVYAFSGPAPAQFSVRQAPQVIGMGLLEAVDESTILALSDPLDKNGDGIKGVPNWVIDPETGQKHLGRFGWKASKGSIREQTAGALMLDMGVVSPVFPAYVCQQGMQATACKNASLTGGITEQDLQKLTHYIELLGVPSQKSYTSNFAPAIGLPVTVEHSNINRANILVGANNFATAGCIACHTPQMKTGNTHPFAELRNQIIHPYSDLLLHDMGPDLADTLTEGNALPSMWRTPPLWGIGSLPYVQESADELPPQDSEEAVYTPRPPRMVNGVSNARYLHDGRARTIQEAILWHGGEASQSRQNYQAMSASDRALLLAFLNSL